MTKQQKIIKEIKRIILEKEPAAKIYLYGSRARGNMKSDSDWDLLILLNREKITSKVEKNVTSPLYDLEFEIGEVISPMVYTVNEWNTKYKVTPFYSNVMKDGRLL